MNKENPHMRSNILQEIYCKLWIDFDFQIDVTNIFVGTNNFMKTKMKENQKISFS